MQSYDNIVLKPLSLSREHDTTIIYDVNERCFAYSDPADNISAIAHYLDGNHSLTEIYNELLKKQKNLAKGEIIEIIDQIFEKEQLIFKNKSQVLLDSKSLKKYDRILNFLGAYPDNDFIDAQKYQQKIMDAHILVLGVGGGGSHVSHSLAASGVNHLRTRVHEIKNMIK